MWRLVAINFLLLGLLLALAEGALAWLGTRNEPLGIEFLDKVARKLYWANVSFVQYDPDCAQYDAQLGYTLRPGTCTFDSAVFSTEITVNSAGLRDDEAALDAPEIIVLGDSQTMGWGVGNGETFADVVENETGMRTLNAGVSSYGTVRELLMLARLDLSGLETVVLQYSDNDSLENRTYLANGSLETMSRDSYESLITKNAAGGDGYGHYIPAFVREIADRAAASVAGGGGRPLPELEDHDVLLEILSSWAWVDPPPRLLLLEVNNGGRGGYFVRAFGASPKLGDLQAAGLEVITLDTFAILGPDDYLFPDGHLTAEGHRKVGVAVAQALAELD